MESDHRQWEVDEQALLDALDRLTAVMEREGLPYLFMGGFASAVHGRPRWTHCSRRRSTAPGRIWVHGHAHRGAEKSVTPTGVHVRNVAQPVIRHAFRVHCLDGPAAPC